MTYQCARAETAFGEKSRNARSEAAWSKVSRVPDDGEIGVVFLWGH